MEDEEKTKNESLAIIGEFSDLPRLVVVDLDYTLWPFYCEFGEENDEPHLYKEASGILRAFSEKGIHVAVASRTPSPEIATAFLTKLGLHSVFVAQEIYPSWSHKTEHFQRIQTKTEIPFKSMLFFDDENRNIQAVSKMGVTSILVRNGVSLEALRQGLAEFARNSGSI